LLDRIGHTEFDVIKLNIDSQLSIQWKPLKLSIVAVVAATIECCSSSSRYNRMLIAATSIVKIAFADPAFIAPGQQGPDRNLQEAYYRQVR
jgi:hypothetical protein